MIMPYRNPIATAKGLATLDRMSGVATLAAPRSMYSGNILPKPSRTEGPSAPSDKIQSDDAVHTLEGGPACGIEPIGLNHLFASEH